MVATHKVPRFAEKSTLLVTDRIDERLLRRAAAIATSRDSDLQVYCPVVMPLLPHSSALGNAPPWQDDVSLARQHARREAGKIMSLLSELPVESHVETGICPSITERIVSASQRLEPDLVLLPRADEHRLIDKPFHAQHEDIWSMVAAPTAGRPVEAATCHRVAGSEL